MFPLRVLVFRPGTAPAVEEMANELEAMQALVGGYLELVFLPNGYLAIANEEGLLQGLAPSVHIGEQVIVGTVFVAKIDPADPENFAGLTDHDVEAVQAWVHPLTAVS